MFVFCSVSGAGGTAIPCRFAASGVRNPTQNVRPTSPAFQFSSFARGSVSRKSFIPSIPWRRPNVYGERNIDVGEPNSQGTIEHSTVAHSPTGALILACDPRGDRDRCRNPRDGHPSLHGRERGLTPEAYDCAAALRQAEATRTQIGLLSLTHPDMTMEGSTKIWGQCAVEKKVS